MSVSQSYPRKTNGNLHSLCFAMRAWNPIKDTPQNYYTGSHLFSLGGGGEEKRGWKNGERGKDAKKGRGRREGPSEKAPTAAATLAVREGKGLGGATGSGESRQKPSSTRSSGDSGSCLQVGAPTKEETLNVTVIQFYFKILRQTVRGNLQLPIIMTASAYWTYNLHHTGRHLFLR